MVAADILCHAQEGIPFVSSDKKPTKTVNPIYPESAKSAGIQGSVLLEVTIGKEGEIEVAHAIRGPAELRSAAIEAVK